MALMFIERVIYDGKRYEFDSGLLDHGLVVIEGDNGTGKTTFCNLIYFALGGEVVSFRRATKNRHEQITDDTDNYAQLNLRIAEERYIVRRYIGDNDITVIRIVGASEGTGSGSEPDGGVESVVQTDSVEVLPVNRSRKADRIFSDWLLDHLGISVIELFHGHKTFKVNITDLMRLVYHDQQPNPEKVFKAPDTSSTLVADSELVRKAIFELLIGKAYSEYYDAVTDERRLKQRRDVSRETLSEYARIAESLFERSGVRNIEFLQKEINEKEQQSDRLQLTRESFKRNRKQNSGLTRKLDRSKEELIAVQLRLSDRREQLMSKLDERYKLRVVRENASAEIARIEKVVFSHDSLNLFSAGTCPYCLTKIEREEGKCVCGAPIEEQQYERFFYTSQEYKEILKSKIKAFSTIESAYEDCDADVSSIKQEIARLESSSLELERSLKRFLSEASEDLDVSGINEIDDALLGVREEISHLRQLFDIESKVDELQVEYDRRASQAREAELARKELEVLTQRDISKKVETFSDTYGRLMKRTLPDCRSARIALDDYMPIINDGMYRESSSLVSIRLMYFVTMMHMALGDDTVPFPRFLLIDTPETAGIELQRLVQCMEELNTLGNYGRRYQVILTTGIGKYPEGFGKYRILSMPDKSPENMLLKRKARLDDEAV